MSTDAPAVDMAAERARVLDKRAEEWATARARMLLGRVRASDEPTTLRDAALVEWPAFTPEARCRIVERALELERSGDGSRHLDPATTSVQPMEKPEERRGGRPTGAQTVAIRAGLREILPTMPQATARDIYDEMARRGMTTGPWESFQSAHVGEARKALGIVYRGPGVKNGKKPATVERPSNDGQTKVAAAHLHDPHEVSPGESPRSGSGVQVDAGARLSPAVADGPVPTGPTGGEHTDESAAGRAPARATSAPRPPVTLDVLVYEAEQGVTNGSRTASELAAQPAAGVLVAAPGEPRRGDAQPVAEDLDAQDRAPTGAAGASAGDGQSVARAAEDARRWEALCTLRADFGRSHLTDGEERGLRDRLAEAETALAVANARWGPPVDAPADLLVIECQTVDCASCGQPACTTEECLLPGHGESCELTDGRWVCSEPCWVAAAEDGLSPETRADWAAAAAYPEMRRLATAGPDGETETATGEAKAASGETVADSQVHTDTERHMPGIHGTASLKWVGYCSCGWGTDEVEYEIATDAANAHLFAHHPEKIPGYRPRESSAHQVTQAAAAHEVEAVDAVGTPELRNLEHEGGDPDEPVQRGAVVSSVAPVGRDAGVTEPARPSIEAYQRGDGSWSIRATGPLAWICRIVRCLE